jgi:CRISPR-associated protein Csb2
MLTLEIELLTGVYRAALSDGSAAEWPPHPERIFSALVQAWSDGGCDSLERAALDWFETLGAPLIEANAPNEVSERGAPIVFVPPNDARGHELAVLPDRRRRQARFFRAAVPSTSVVRLGWPQVHPPEQHRACLDVLAHRVASLGHSSSFVRFAFLDQEIEVPEHTWRPSVAGEISLRIPHTGRRQNLASWHERDERPRAGATARYLRPGEPPPREPVKSCFGDPTQWFVFEGNGGFQPDIIAFAHVAKRVRDALMSLSVQPVPEILSGHAASGGATTQPHVAVVPCAYVGWEHATGDLLGFAVVMPRQADPDNRALVLQALARFARLEQGGACAQLHFGDAGTWKLEHVPAPVRASLKPARWCATARTWASATPVLLDRFPDRGNATEEAGLIASACRNVGLPEPVEIEIHKHSAIRGAPSAYVSRGRRPKPDWSFPAGASFAGRPRRQVVLRFAEPVEGPLLLGAGRFHGIGMCLPLDPDGSR